MVEVICLAPVGKCFKEVFCSLKSGDPILLPNSKIYNDSINPIQAVSSPVLITHNGYLHEATEVSHEPTYCRISNNLYTLLICTYPFSGKDANFRTLIHSYT